MEEGQPPRIPSPLGTDLSELGQVPAKAALIVCMRCRIVPPAHPEDGRRAPPFLALHRPYAMFGRRSRAFR
jgi:hypothetical protein